MEKLDRIKQLIRIFSQKRESELCYINGYIDGLATARDVLEGHELNDEQPGPPQPDNIPYGTI